MGKFITVAIADKALYLGGELDIQAETSCRDNKCGYKLSLGEHRFEFSVAGHACCRGRSKTSKNFIWKYE